MRFEEIQDSSDDDGQGVGLDLGVLRTRYASDELRFTGVDLSSSGARRRRTNAYEEDSDYSDDKDVDEDGEEDEEDGGQVQHTQIILREKEDSLVERALERIRRARELGKTNVKLSQAEVDALERAERIQQQAEPPRIAKEKRAVKGRPKAVQRKRSKSDKLSSSSSTPALKAIEPRRKSKSSALEEPQSPYPMPSGPKYGQTAGAMMYALPAYPAAPAVPAAPAQRPRSSSSKTGSRAASSHSLRQHQQHTPPLPQFQHPYSAGRYFSNPDVAYASRPLSNTALGNQPSDPNWEPRARSASNLVPYPVSQPPYPVYQPSPLQFDPRDPRVSVLIGSRMASGSPEMYPVPPYPVSQLPAYRHPQDEMFSHGPTTAGQSSSAGDNDEMEEEEDDDDQGVEIEVIEQGGGSYEVQTRSGAAAAAAGNRGRGGGLIVSKRRKRGK